VTTRILVADDEPDLELLITQKFRKQIRDGQFSFLFAHDGEEALALLARQDDIDLVLSDINMPRMDGLTLLERLAENKGDLKAVIVSAYGDMQNIRTAMNRGAFDFLTKPIAFDDLHAIIRKTLAEIERLRALRRGRDEAERVRSVLARYFSPNLADRLASDPRFLELGGERRPVTFMFTDLSGFTSLVESQPPGGVVPLLNSYLDQLTQIVFQHEGTVVKVLGDAVYAMFGAPEPQADHAQQAIACALAIDAFARDFETQQQAEGLALGVTRIGVNSGSAIIGNFGGKLFFDYTAHGDAINVAARLESANKHFGTRICASGATVAEIPGFKGRPIAELVVMGRKEALQAHEPLCDAAFHAPRTAAYTRAYALLAAGDAGAARKAFATYVGEHEDDPLAFFHLRRLLAGESSPRVALNEK